MTMKAPLAGRVVALPETRELDRLAELLEAEGARAWRCPLVAILDAPDPAPVEAWLRALAAGRFDDVVFLTGEGLRRLMALAERRGFAADVVAALGRARKITRGPKPARALKEIGLHPDVAAAVPTSQGIIDELRKLNDIRGRTVGVQLYGTEPNRPLVSFIEGEGARVEVVAPYVYAPESDGRVVGELIDAIADARVDVVAFDVARASGKEDRLRPPWPRVRVAAIGPVAAEALQRHGVTPDILPGKAYVMKNLVAAIVAAIAAANPAAAGPR
jgi:uroporphyrinogen-III synthase